MMLVYTSIPSVLGRKRYGEKTHDIPSDDSCIYLAHSQVCSIDPISFQKPSRKGRSFMSSTLKTQQLVHIFLLWKNI